MFYGALVSWCCAAGELYELYVVILVGIVCELYVVKESYVICE